MGVWSVARNDSTADVGRRLLALGDAEGAAVEFRRRLMLERASGSDSLSGSAWAPLAEALAWGGDRQAAALAWRNAARHATDAADEDAARCEEALLLMGGREYAGASLVLYGLESTASDSLMKRRAAYLSGLCALEHDEWGEARGLFQEALRDSLTCRRSESAQRLNALLLQAEKMPMRSPAKARLLSTFVPGLGQAYAGSFWNGVNALGLNVLCGYTVYSSVQRRAWDKAGPDLLFLFARYYAGNRYQAGIRAKRANEKRARRLRAEATHLAREAAGVTEHSP